MGSSRIIDKDKGYRALKRQILDAQDIAVKIGVLEAEGEHGKSPGVTVAQVAAWNEFGTSDGHVPERPAFRRAIDSNMDKIDSAIGRLAGQVVDGKITTDQMLAQLGLLGQGLVRREITVLDDPPNAPSTIKAKGSSNPLIDSSQTRRAINYEVVRGNAARRARQGASNLGMGGGA